MAYVKSEAGFAYGCVKVLVNKNQNSAVRTLAGIDAVTMVTTFTFTFSPDTSCIFGAFPTRWCTSIHFVMKKEHELVRQN